MLVLAFLTLQRKAAARAPCVLLRHNLKQNTVLSSDATVRGQSPQRTTKDPAREGKPFPDYSAYDGVIQTGIWWSGKERGLSSDAMVCEHEVGPGQLGRSGREDRAGLAEAGLGLRRAEKGRSSRGQSWRLSVRDMGGEAASLFQPLRSLLLYDFRRRSSWNLCKQRCLKVK